MATKVKVTANLRILRLLLNSQTLATKMSKIHWRLSENVMLRKRKSSNYDSKRRIVKDFSTTKQMNVKVERIDSVKTIGMIYRNRK